MIFLHHFNKYIQNKLNQINNLNQGIQQKSINNRDMIVTYDNGKVIKLEGKSLHILQCEIKQEIDNGVFFALSPNKKYPERYTTIKNGILDGFYFALVETSDEFAKKYLCSLGEQKRIAAISGMYKNGYTEYVNCILFDTDYELLLYKKHKIHINHECGGKIYEVLFKHQEKLDGWSLTKKYYKHYTNGVLNKRITKNYKEYSIFANDFTYEYELFDDRIELEVFADKSSIYSSVLKIVNDSCCSKHSISLKQDLDDGIPIVKYTWYKNDLKIIMKKHIAPNYISHAKYELVKLHDGTNALLWTKMDFDLNELFKI